VNRREFLKLRVRGRERVLELSCESLYMRYVDAQAGAGLARVAHEGMRHGVGWNGEPPLDVDAPTIEDLFSELDARLSTAQVLKVIGREWLSRGDFAREVESRIETFRRRGGRVE
jgi:hypothetical protein